MFSKRYSGTVSINNMQRVMMMLILDVIIIIASVWLATALRLTIS